MSDDVFVPYDKMPKPHTGSFLTAKEIESFKNAFKDFVHVVRCKDCKYYDYFNGCMSWHDVNSNNDNWYCADGEGRTDDG